jgi:hypothetical protein
MVTQATDSKHYKFFIIQVKRKRGGRKGGEVLIVCLKKRLTEGITYVKLLMLQIR